MRTVDKTTKAHITSMPHAGMYMCTLWFVPMPEMERYGVTISLKGVSMCADTGPETQKRQLKGNRCAERMEEGERPFIAN